MLSNCMLANSGRSPNICCNIIGGIPYNTHKIKVIILKLFPRSGKVPKFFKMIPQYRNWEELLCITQPDEWSAAAVFRATKIFTSGLKTNMAQRFYNQAWIP